MNNYLRNLTRGSRVYVEANLEVREPVPDAAPGSPQSMRQVFLRHGKCSYPDTVTVLSVFIETLRVLDLKKPKEGSES